MRIFWWKKKIDISRTILTLISINGQYCAMSQNLFWPPFLNRIFFFFKFFFQKCKCIHVQLGAKFYYWIIPLGKWFLKFWSCDFLHEMKIHFLATILKQNIFFIILFTDIWVFWVYTHNGGSFVPKFLRESTQKWMGPSGPPFCTNRVKSSLGTYMLRKHGGQQSWDSQAGLPPCAQTGVKRSLRKHGGQQSWDS